LERYVQFILKILRDGHSLSIANLECSFLRTLPSHFFDQTPSIGITVWRNDLDPRDELLKSESFTVGKSAVWSKGIWSRLAKEFECQVDQPPGPVHSTGRNVDVDKHAVDCGPQGLEKSTP
jgi:hypothetical protein